MKIYIFYSKNNKTKEPLGHTKADTVEGAVKIFAKLKRLEIGEFTKLFEVEEKEK